MKSVLIVEDEKMIRQGIKKMIQRSSVSVDMILECSNGEMALEILREQPIDVMFTDIRMPKMDGITLVKEIENLENRPLTVAISGYDDFSYAVELMRHGVREYILKPVERGKIEEILIKLNEEIEANEKKKHNSAQIGMQQLKYMILNEHLSDRDQELLNKQFQNNFYESGYRICALEDTDEFSTGDNYIFLNGMEDHSIFIIEENKLQLLLKNELSRIAVGVSAIHHGILECRQAYQEAVRMRKAAFCMEEQAMIYGEEHRTVTDFFGMAEKIASGEELQKRVQLLGTDKTEEIIELWEHFFTEVKKGKVDWDIFEKHILDFISEVQKTYKNIIGDELEEVNRLRAIFRYQSLTDYSEDFTDWVLELHERIGSQFDVNKNKQKIVKAIEYIRENYASDLNMAVVSNYVSMNYSLFSYSFKQFTGSNFVNYLKEIRIREAQRLLRETDLKVNEISQVIGYDNEKHFMKTFKSTCGVSPSEYRKNMQLIED